MQCLEDQNEEMAFSDFQPIVDIAQNYRIKLMGTSSNRVKFNAFAQFYEPLPDQNDHNNLPNECK